MALITCKECGNQISKSAVSCPTCGNTKLHARQYGCGPIILIGFVGLVIYNMVNPSTYKAPEPKTREQKIAALFIGGSATHCKYWIKSQLKDPDSYEEIETHYTAHENYVDVFIKYRAKNSFNGFVIDQGTCTLSLDNKVLDGTASFNSLE
jgi:hypothetical protein